MTRAARFSQADLTRAVRAAEKAGLSVGRIRIEPGGAIEIVAGDPENADNDGWWAGSRLYKGGRA